jgi:hypothetical protein
VVVVALFVGELVEPVGDFLVGPARQLLEDDLFPAGDSPAARALRSLAVVLWSNRGTAFLLSLDALDVVFRFFLLRPDGIPCCTGTRQG